MNKYCLLVLVMLTLLVSSCGEYAYVQKSPDYEYRYEVAKAYYVEGKYGKAAQLFGDLIGVLKGTAYGEESFYLLAMSEFRNGDYETAASYFKKYYQTYPKGVYVEYARYYSALSQYKQTPDPRLDQTSTLEAMTEFQAFLDAYPYTPLKASTQEILLNLQDKLVEKEYLSAKLYYDLGTYMGNCTSGGSNYEACVITAQNALNDYPYASAERREDLSILILRSKYYLARESVIEKRIERFRNAIDEYYAFVNDFPESRYLKEAKRMFEYSDAVVRNKGAQLDEE